MLDVFDYWAEKYGVKPEFILREPLKSLVPEITKRGWKYHPVRFTFWSDGNPPMTDEDIFHNGLQNARAIQEIERIIQTTKPDLVMTNSVVAPWAALAAHFQKVPHIWFVREYGDLDHGRVFEIGREKTLEDVGNLSTLVVTNSSTLANHVMQYVDKQKVTTLYNPFNIQEIRAKVTEKVTDPFKNKSSLKLVLTGNIAGSKGQLEAIQAVGLLAGEGHNVELCFVGKSGDSDFARKLEDTIKRLGIEKKVHFVGYQTNPLPFVALADVGIMPSRMEAFGRITFEYLVAGKPVVGSDSGATPEMVKPNTNGYLFKPQDPASLAEAIKNYVRNRDLVSQHGEASKQIATDMMNGNLNADALYKKIRKIADSTFDPTTKPINYMHRWIEYLEIAQKSINNSGALSIRRLAKARLRQKAKAVYIRGRRLGAKIAKR